MRTGKVLHPGTNSALGPVSGKPQQLGLISLHMRAQKQAHQEFAARPSPTVPGAMQIETASEMLAMCCKVCPQMNADLHSRLWKLTTDVVAILSRSPWSSRTAPTTAVEVEQYQTRFASRLATAWATLLHENWGTVRNLSSHTDLTAWLTSSDAPVAHARRMVTRGDGLPLSEEDLAKYFDQHVITKFIVNYLPQFGAPQIDQAKFDALYLAFEDWLLRETSTIITRAVLSAFQCSDEMVEICEGVTIRRATNDDFTEIANLVGSSHQASGQYIGYGRSLVEVVSKGRSVGGGQRQRTEYHSGRVNYFTTPSQRWRFLRTRILERKV